MQAWFKIATVSATMLVATPAAGDTSARSAAGLLTVGSRDLAHDGRRSNARKVEPDPTDGASIIVECIADRGRETSDGDTSRESLKPRFAELSLVTMPRVPLGPSECGSDDEHARWKFMPMARGEKVIAAFPAPAVARTDFAQDRETHRKIGQTAQGGLHEMQSFVSLPEVLSARSRLPIDSKRKLP